MRLLFVVDGRSPIANNWISHFVERGEEVHLVSTFDCQPDFDLASYTFVPVAYSQLKAKKDGEDNIQTGKGLLWSSSFVNVRTSMRRIIAPFTIPRAARHLTEIIDDIQPDLVHAMRIPYEGLLAAEALASQPKQRLLISVWGNDFTLHAGATPWMAKYTRRALERANGLHTDCYRDQRLAYEWGYKPTLPAVVIPGNGGVQLELFYPPQKGIDDRKNTVINPRGFRSYIRNDTFFNAIPKIISELQEVRFICPGMATETQAKKWVEDLSISRNVELLPPVSRSEMAALFRRSAVSVSPSVHDGTPNTLLEAMACGCFPVAGDIESLHEWIESGVNGTLFDPADSGALADAVVKAFKEPELLLKAAAINSARIEEQAEFHSGMDRALEYYQSIITNREEL
jgi:glycosyltransferase involved in cell wall biosynthesis